MLELLATGSLLGFTKDKHLRRKLWKDADRIWYEIDRRQLYRFLERLHLKQYIEFIKARDGVEKARITNKGKARFLELQFKNLVLQKPKKWDRRWRLVLFDIPESKKKIRDALRRKLKELGFLEFQKSVFVYPYPCRDEMNFVINFWNIADCVYYLEASIDVDHNLRKRFHL